MKISELIAKLEEIKDDDGDLQVHVYTYGDIVATSAREVQVLQPRRKPSTGAPQPFVLIDG